MPPQLTLYASDKEYLEEDDSETYGKCWLIITAVEDTLLVARTDYRTIANATTSSINNNKNGGFIGAVPYRCSIVAADKLVVVIIIIILRLT